MEGNSEICLITIRAGLELDPANAELVALEKVVVEEEKEDCQYENEEDLARNAALTDWMKANGSRFDKLKVRLYNYKQQGLHASRDIKKGEVILFVPMALVIMSKNLVKTEVGQRIGLLQLMHTLSPFVCNLLAESSNPETAFAPLFANLRPRWFPITFTDDQLSWIQGSPLHAAILTMRDGLQKDFELLTKEISEVSQLEFRTFLDLFSVINSRCFKSEDSDCLIPLMDKI